MNTRNIWFAEKYGNLSFDSSYLQLLYLSDRILIIIDSLLFQFI